MADNMSPDELRQFYCNEVFLTIPVVIYTRTDFYLMLELNRKIELFKAAGLIELWDFKGGQKKEFDSSTATQESPKVLTLNHLNGILKIFLFGAVLSFTVFLFELVSQKIFETKLFNIYSE